MTVSAYPAAIQKLVDIFTVAFPSTGDTYVAYGPGISETGSLKRILVGVESQDPALAPGTAGSGRVDWATMGTNHSRDEWFSVVCNAVAESGDDDASGRTTEVFALFGAAVTAVVTDPSIGRPGGVLYVDTYEWTYLPDANADGTFGVIQFTFNFRARI